MSMNEYAEPVRCLETALAEGHAAILEGDLRLRAGKKAEAAGRYRDASLRLLRAAHEAARVAAWIDHDADLAGYTDQALTDCLTLMEPGKADIMANRSISPPASEVPAGGSQSTSRHSAAGCRQAEVSAVEGEASKDRDAAADRPARASPSHYPGGGGESA